MQNCGITLRFAHERRLGPAGVSSYLTTPRRSDIQQAHTTLENAQLKAGYVHVWTSLLFRGATTSQPCALRADQRSAQSITAVAALLAAALLGRARHAPELLQPRCSM